MIVDTDLPTVGQIPSRSELSPAAAIDSVRIDVFDAQGGLVETRDSTAIDERSWPVTFGVASPDGGGEVTLRIRIFRASQSLAGTAEGKPTTEPDRGLAVDRLVTLDLPVKGVSTARVRLFGDCIGVPVSFLDRKTCIDGEHLAGAVRDGVELSPKRPEASAVGTWKPAIEVACKGTPRDRARCIPGGFTVLGDANLSGFDDDLDTVPRRPAVVYPFFYDETEFTVGRFRALAATLTNPEPLRNDPSNPQQKYCSYLGPDDATNDALPLSCVSPLAAQEICELDGGSLPTEAEFEHAARGRGQGRSFPWGEALPRCCHTSAERTSNASIPISGSCDGEGPEPVGSHPKTDDCEGDVSRDGILDLGGSLHEWMRDIAQSFDEPCWAGGLLRDPVCAVASLETYGARGTDWSASFFFATGAHRTYGKGPASINGFRCRYPAGGPR